MSEEIMLGYKKSLLNYCDRQTYVKMVVCGILGYDENNMYHQLVGEFYDNGYMFGNSTIECGIGKLTLDLEGGKDLYAIEAEHGIGEIKLNGNKIEDNKVQGSGENKIKIEGGIGEIQINM